MSPSLNNELCNKHCCDSKIVALTFVCSDLEMVCFGFCLSFLPANHQSGLIKLKIPCMYIYIDTKTEQEILDLKTATVCKISNSGFVCTIYKWRLTVKDI